MECLFQFRIDVRIIIVIILVLFFCLTMGMNLLFLFFFFGKQPGFFLYLFHFRIRDHTGLVHFLRICDIDKILVRIHQCLFQIRQQIFHGGIPAVLIFHRRF